MNDAQRLARLNEARIALAGDHTTAEEILILDQLARYCYYAGKLDGIDAGAKAALEGLHSSFKASHEEKVTQ